RTADKPAFCWRSFRSRIKPSQLQHACRCYTAQVAEAVVETRHQTPDLDRPFAAVRFNNLDSDEFAFC
ncbi:MAG: hypothetical protein ACI85V_003334, partial [bacterium]